MALGLGGMGINVPGPGGVNKLTVVQPLAAAGSSVNNCWTRGGPGSVRSTGSPLMPSTTTTWSPPYSLFNASRDFDSAAFSELLETVHFAWPELSSRIAAFLSRQPIKASPKSVETPGRAAALVPD